MFATRIDMLGTANEILKIIQGVLLGAWWELKCSVLVVKLGRFWGVVGDEI